MEVIMSRRARLKQRWTKFWMRFAGAGVFGRFATCLAAKAMPPFYGCVPLAKYNPHGYVSNTAVIHHADLTRDKHCFIGDRVTIYQDAKGAEVQLGEGVHLHKDNTIQTGQSGSVTIGTDTHIQPGCQISAYVKSINIGSGVEIAPNCAFYSYNHNMQPDAPIRKQPLTSRGSISIGDEVWLGYGVIVLDGVSIGNGAVIGAGSLVVNDIPENAIAVGMPARVIKSRNELE